MDARWERCKKLKELRDSGKTLRECGQAFGVSVDRIRQLLEAYERIERERQRDAAGPGSAPWWDGLNRRVRNELKGRGFKSREDCIRVCGGNEAPKGIPPGVFKDVREWLGLPMPEPETSKPKACA